MKNVLPGALCEYMYVAEVSNCFHLAEIAGWRTIFLGLVVFIDQVNVTTARENFEAGYLTNAAEMT